MRITIVVVMCTAVLGGCAEPVKVTTTLNEPGLGDPPDNTSPTITGQPEAAVLYADVYQFRPNATDADGDKLIFSVENKPDWADFDSATGALSGRPEMSSVGVYDDVVISVSDGVEKDSLPPFSIRVIMNTLGSVTLNWTPPTQNTDGTPLLNLAGYYIYVGKKSGAYDRKITISNSGITSYVVENLLPDRYYFAASSFNSSGLEGDLSPEAVKTVN